MPKKSREDTKQEVVRYCQALADWANETIATVLQAWPILVALQTFGALGDIPTLVFE